MSNGVPSIIQIRDLRKIYRVGRIDVPALRGANLDVPAGEFLSIVGPSGSGKSTLFHIIGGLTPPTSGQVKVGGQDLASMTDPDRTGKLPSRAGHSPRSEPAYRPDYPHDHP
jgi:putative ABC transport system ATP-binding protein